MSATKLSYNQNMDKKELNPEKKWAISAKHLELQKLKLHLGFANVLIRKGPNLKDQLGPNPL